MSSHASPLIAVLGPTGSGKSNLALELAEKFAGEIVNYDSVQLYRGLNVGSAKIAMAERRGIPHHLLDVVTVNQDLTAGDYARLAAPVLRGIAARGGIPILVGGTGFYLRALLAGLSPAPARDATVRARIAQSPPAALHRFLRRFDPVTAARIHPNDRQKLIRAVELSLLSGRPASATHSAPRRPLTGFAVLKLGLAPDREELTRQLDARSARLFEDGLLSETEGLLRAGASPQAKALQSLGYRQAVGVLTQGLPLANAVIECQTKTRQYAKRQRTWFRSEPGVIWLAGFGHQSSIRQEAISVVTQFLAEHASR